ncbi:MAG: nuclease, partial [Nocardioidaceae bacterium]|nr:nuclease [Nocardioidaceae bacterium]
HRRLAVAAALDSSRRLTREAMARGDIAEDQATVIVRALEALPADLDSAVVERAEKELVRLAEHHDAADLTRLGKRILDVAAPEIGDEQERRVLEREEETAVQTARFTMTDDGHGRCHGRFTLPSAQGAMLRKVLLALASPRRTHDTVRKPGPERMGRAFAEYVERYPTDRLPAAGGVAASVVVTMTLTDLTGTTNQPALLDTGQSITAGEARRLACEAGIVPVVLDGASRPLDVGRQKRFHTPAQRIAIALRDKTCTADGCDYPPSLCHVHHDIPYSQGGATNMHTGRLLCPKHHRIAHHPRYRMKEINNGRVVFARC